jgi:hypothetical protein
MKKNFYLLAFFLLQIVCCFSQTIKVNSNVLTIDTTAALYPMVKKTGNPILPAIPDTSIKLKVWLEDGNGSFTTDPLASSTIVGKQGHLPLLLSTRIYDTTGVPPRTRISYGNMSLVSTKAANSFTNILSKPEVRITSSVSDIVPGDPMVFALTYKTYMEEKITVQTEPIKKDIKEEPKARVSNMDSTEKFNLYFFYNNNNSFSPVIRTDSLTGMPIPSIRTHNDEVVSFYSAIPNAVLKVIDSFKFKDWLCYNIPNNSGLEKTVFLSLTPYANLELGKSGSVYAILTNQNGVILGKDSILNMRFAPAHDPNYIVQQPFCLKLPKKNYPFNYTIHFQNTGAGDAKEVKIIVHLPKGLNYNTFKVKKATFANVDYKSNFINTTSNKNLIIDKINNTIEIIFVGHTTSRKDSLLGTASSSNPSIDERTMGEILFSIKATVNVDDSLKSCAEIFFRSIHPSSNTIDGYEIPVRTKTAITSYKECCTCPGVEVLPIQAVPLSPDIPLTAQTDKCFKILGLCWWWVIIMIIILLIWWLIAKKKRDNQNQINRSDRS